MILKIVACIFIAAPIVAIFIAIVIQFIDDYKTTRTIDKF